MAQGQGSQQKPGLGTAPGTPKRSAQGGEDDGVSEKNENVSPFLFRPVWVYKAFRCPASDSWLGSSLAESPKYCVASLDLEMQHLKYLYLTKRPPMTLE